MANVLDLYNRFKGGGAGGKMVYPLENQSDYLGKITFTPIQEVITDITEEIGNLYDLGSDAIQQGNKVIKNIISGGDTTADKRVGGFEDIYQEKRGDTATDNQIIGGTLQSTIDNASSGFYGAGKTTSSKAFDEGALNLTTSKRISLYLPKAIQIQDTVTFDNAFQLGLIGGAIEAGFASGAGGIGAGAGAAVQELAGIGNTLMGRTGGMSKEAAGILAGKIAAKAPFIGGDAQAGAVRSATRLTTNPNTRALFKDVPIRNFSFAFQLIPTSRAEALMVENIIKTFREELYPEALTAGGVNIGYRFPNRFLIKVKYNKQDIKGIRFLPVYMQSFNATYNASTGGMHSDGRFSGVDISMAFTETRAIAKADIQGGY